VPRTPEVVGITRATSLRQWRAPHLTEDGVGAEGALLDAAVRGRRRAVAEHLVLRLLLLVLRHVRLSVLPLAAGVVGGRDAAEAKGRGGLTPVGPIGGYGLGRGHGWKALKGSVWGFGGDLGRRGLGGSGSGGGGQEETVRWRSLF
jgi:hypothetical protein